jgi:hypothetical protein
MSKTYNHLNLEERAVMQVMLDHDCSLRAIARKLSRNASTISRELARSGGAVAHALDESSPGRPRIACGCRCAKAHRRAQRLASKARVTRKMVPAWGQILALGQGKPRQAELSVDRGGNPKASVRLHLAVQRVGGAVLRPRTPKALKSARCRRPRYSNSVCRADKFAPHNPLARCLRFEETRVTDSRFFIGLIW